MLPLALKPRKDFKSREAFQALLLPVAILALVHFSLFFSIISLTCLAAILEFFSSENVFLLYVCSSYISQGWKMVWEDACGLEWSEKYRGQS